VQNRSYSGSASSGGAAPEKLGRLPLAVSAISVNWLTTSAAPRVSSSERSNLPSRSKIRRRATLPASRARDPLDDRLQPRSITRAAYRALPGRSERASL
jgi:hypothetical protein